MNRTARLLVVGGLLALAAAAGCGPLDDLPTGPLPGQACAVDADCVPNGCCGQGTAAVHVTSAPDCSTVKCSGSCPLNQVNCGCGVPVCRDSRCTVAQSFDPACQ